MLLDKAQDILGRLIAPLSYDQFFDEIVGQGPVTLLGKNTTERHLLLGPDPKKTFLEAYKDYAPNLKCHAAKPTGPAPQPRSAATASDFAALINEYHTRDYTVRIPSAGSITPEVSLLTRALEVILRKPADAILFWSPKGGKAPIHYDHVDVIAIQLYGTKRWHISNEPPETPNKWPRVGDTPAKLGHYSSYDVQPGDMIYFPRGTAHTVESTSESIHIAIEFVPLTVRDAINSALDHLSNLNKPLRLDAGKRADDQARGEGLDVITQQVLKGLDELTANCQSLAFVETALAHTYARMIKDMPKLTAPEKTQPITVESKVRRSALAVAQLMTTSTIADFTQPGEQVLVHRGAAECLQFLASKPEFTVSEIPGSIDDEVRIALASKMVSTGFLELVA
jgi:ribosomal protein L16 Arg81 hydroxylase